MFRSLVSPGAPFTLASYAIEGGGSKGYLETKKMMYTDEGMWNALMRKLSRAVAGYPKRADQSGRSRRSIVRQLDRLFVGCADYARYVQPHVRSIFDQLDKSVPSIHFGTGNPELYPLMKDAGGDVIGVDWRLPLGQAWDRIGHDRAIMGNLDPGALLAPQEVMFERASAVLNEAKGRAGHIFNLGHGIMPQASVAQARVLVEHVHEASAKAV